MAGVGETWRPVIDWEGVYEVSDQGQVRNVKADGRGRVVGKVLRQRPTRWGHLRVELRRDGVRYCVGVHRLVARAFIDSNPADGLECCHNDGDPANNVPSNLRWDTSAGNSADTVRLGRSRNQNTAKSVCVRGHELNEQNTYVTPSTGARHCRPCTRMLQRRWRRG